ncbi:MAG: methyltransferase [Alphaproteobacteria bacterium]
MIEDKTAFIRAHTAWLAVPHAPEISLYLADEITEIWKKTEDDLEKIGLPPPFWAFAWAGGQSLARYVLDHPDLVRGKTVLDFASGSGLVAIAAAKVGASRVEANEIDDFALAAIALNAEDNNATVKLRGGDLIGTDDKWDVVLAGDIAYERDMTARVFAWLHTLVRRGATVLIGDPGRAFLPKAGLEELAEYRVPTTREIEDTEIKRTKVFRLLPG